MSVFDPVILSQLQQLAKSTADAAAALSAAVANVEGDVATVSGKVTTVNTAVGAVSGQVTGVNTAVATLQGTANTISATVNAINAAGGTKGIKSVQRGVISILGSNLTASVTISAVNPGKSELRFLGAVPSTNWTMAMAFLSLTNATTITATRKGTDGSIGTDISWELTEWN